jgi:pyruvate formate lyase activating enzyme
VKGIRVALDTAGAAPADDVPDAVLAALDLVLLDIKSFDPLVHRQVTGGDVALVRTLARRVAALGRPLRLTFVVVPGLTDEKGNVAALADFAAGLGTVERVDVVPFHRGGQAGWEAAGLRFPLADRPGPTREALAEVRAAFSAVGLTVG